VIALTTYVPAYVQGARGAGPTLAGLVLGAMSLGWALAAGLSGRLYVRLGVRDTALVGSSLCVGGAVGLAALGAPASIWCAAAACLVLGLGVGLSHTPLLVAAQALVPWRQRGVVTSANMFSRAIGGAVGVAAFGALANASLGQSADDVAGALGAATHAVFVALIGVGVATALIIGFIPRRLPRLMVQPSALSGSCA
jgi:MFS family permease